VVVNTARVKILREIAPGVKVCDRPGKLTLRGVTTKRPSSCCPIPLEEVRLSIFDLLKGIRDQQDVSEDLARVLSGLRRLRRRNAVARHSSRESVLEEQASAVGPVTGAGRVLTKDRDRFRDEQLVRPAKRPVRSCSHL
jgi:hypothetical protein